MRNKPTSVTEAHGKIMEAAILLAGVTEFLRSVNMEKYNDLKEFAKIWDAQEALQEFIDANKKY